MSTVTIYDIAQAAGVSATTVSHVFSGNRPVSASTREHVENVASRLGYRPNAVARSLRSSKTETIMVVVPDISNPFYPEFARGIQDATADAGYLCMFCNTDGNVRNEHAALNQALSRRLDGVIYTGFRSGQRDLAPLAEAGIPVVHAGRLTDPTAPIDSVYFDDRAAAYAATTYLLDRWGGPVAYIGGMEAAQPTRYRRAGYEDAVRDHDQPLLPLLELATEFNRAGGAAGLRKLMAGDVRPRAVLCASDVIAFGAIEAAKELGLSIPKDVAIAGYDDIDAATIVSPALTTVRTDAREIGRTCGALLLSRMDRTYSGVGREVVLDHELVVRASA